MVKEKYPTSTDPAGFITTPPTWTDELGTIFLPDDHSEALRLINERQRRIAQMNAYHARQRANATQSAKARRTKKAASDRALMVAITEARAKYPDESKNVSGLASRLLRKHGGSLGDREHRVAALAQRIRRLEARRNSPAK